MEKTFSLIAWIKNALSPTLAGLIAGLVTWHNTQAFIFKLLAVLFVIAGIIGGILLAEWIKRKYGSEEFIAETDAAPDLDKKNE